MLLEKEDMLCDDTSCVCTIETSFSKVYLETWGGFPNAEYRRRDLAIELARLLREKIAQLLRFDEGSESGT